MSAIVRTDQGENIERTPSFVVLTFQSRNVPDIDGFPKYIAEVSAGFCPYIEASASKDNITYTILYSNTYDKMIAERLIFASGYAFSELLRKKRTGFQERSPLLCENVLFLFPMISDSSGKEILGWPHWVLKCRYTQLGILFGKFWKGAEELSKSGIQLPVPPCHFLSIRESVRTKDPQFFDHAEWLRPALEASNDNGQNVFYDILGGDGIETWIGKFCQEPTQCNLELVGKHILETDFYTRAKDSAAEELTKYKKVLNK